MRRSPPLGSTPSEPGEGDALFSSVTHDLHAPGVDQDLGHQSAAGRGAVRPRSGAGELLQTVLEETDRLNRLVGNILGLAQVRSAPCNR